MPLVAENSPVGTAGDTLFMNALLGGGLPDNAAEHLRLAAHSYAIDPVAERHLRDAELLAPGHAAVLIGLYRFFFYKGRLAEAREVAIRCMTNAAASNGLMADWRRVRPADASFGCYDDMAIRFYLFALKGYAYLSMRLGDLAEGGDAVAKLLELDPRDRIGARVLLGVLERIGQDDE